MWAFDNFINWLQVNHFIHQSLTELSLYACHCFKLFENVALFNSQNNSMLKTNIISILYLEKLRSREFK